MSEYESRQAISKALGAFEKHSMASAAMELFKVLGYESDRRLTLKPNTPDHFFKTLAPGKQVHETKALLSEWQTADFLFQFTSEELLRSGAAELALNDKNPFDKSLAKSFLFVAIALKGERYTRTDLANITREINKFFLQPVIVLFRHGKTLTLAVIHRRLHKRDESKDVLERVTLIKDIRFADPHRAHLEILSDLSLSSLYERFAFTDFDKLHQAWQRALDSSELNKRFYQELANWYFWALDNVHFPADAPKDRDGHDSPSLIRLITRLVFCWFLKEKGLIPDELFHKQKLQKFLDLSDSDKTTYYKAVLQNLFFATLNTEMDAPGQPPSRKFSAKSHQDHMVHSHYRYESLIKDPNAFLKLFRNVPFLNGGLFECLDERDETKETRVDGFSDNPKNPLEVPDFLFFGDDQRVDLSEVYGELRYSQALVRPLIPLLERYKFTVSENTPIEDEVALDPELLGHVFENLLAAYNPETDTTARKTTGSFYTPRVVVDFMVDESLIAHLESKLGRAELPLRPDSKNSKKAAHVSPSPGGEGRGEGGRSTNQKLRQLLAYTETKPDFSEPEIRCLIDAIDQVKILDPACGSGAYPMGALHKLVFLLRKLDPGNAAWKERQLTKARQLDVAREAAETAVEEAFARDHGDYARKLYLIENCLYGVDIQPIAVQIAKLRCFISLVVEQEPEDKLPNRGILPLPNLETKFIAANTLFGLHRLGQMELRNSAIAEKEAELRAVRHEHFLARRFKTKKTLRARDFKLRAELAKLLKENHQFSGKEAEDIANWDPYRADRSAPFFDPEWMFSLEDQARSRARATLRDNFSLVNDDRGQMELAASGDSAGFDIVIGNPPYVRHEEIKELKPRLKDDYFCYTGGADLYVYFFERSFDLLRVGGTLCFISSNKFFRAAYAERLRHFLAVNGEVQILIDFGETPVFTAIVEPTIVLFRKTRETKEKGLLPSIPKDSKKWLTLVSAQGAARGLKWETGPRIQEFPDIFEEHSFFVKQRDLTPEGWRIESQLVTNVLEKLRQAGRPLSAYINEHFFYGIKTGLNDAFVVDGVIRDRLITEHKSSAELLVPFLRGRDLKKWRSEFADNFLIKIESSENKKHPWSDKSEAEAETIFAKKYPAIYAHFEPLRKELIKRQDQGRFFWELRSCAYWKEFDKPKILYMEINRTDSFSWDDEGYLANNKLFMLPNAPISLLAKLNSLVGRWTIHKLLGVPFGGFLEMQWPRFSLFPVTERDDKAIDSLVTEILKRKKADASAFVANLESEIDGRVAHLYGLTEDEFRTILDEQDLSDPVRIGALNAYRETQRRLAK